MALSASFMASHARQFCNEQHDGNTCTRSFTSLFAAKLTRAKLPLMPFDDTSAAAYVVRLLTTRSKRNAAPLVAETVPTFT